MTGPAPGQHVEIITSLARRPGKDTDNDVGYGTGYLIAPRLVLTARHIVADTTEVTVRFGVIPDGPRIRAHTRWVGTDEVDLAVLDLDEPAPDPVQTPSFGRLQSYPHSVSTHRSWNYHCLGFPALHQGRLRDDRPYRDSITLRGAVRVDAFLRTGLLALDGEAIEGAEADDWRGMSGAPVFAYGRLVGVVFLAQRHPPELHAVPLAAVLGDHRVNLEPFNEPPEGREKFRALLVAHGIDPEISPAHRRPYSATLALALQRTPRLLDRDVERLHIERWIAAAVPYAVWSGAAWSGKTSLAAALAHRQPTGVDVVAHIVSRAAGVSTAGQLFSSLADQLAALLDEPTPDAIRPEPHFDELLTRVAAMQSHLDRRLLVIIDGLDELEDRAAVRSVLARLPARPPDRVSILVFTRPSFDLSAMTDPQHGINRDDSCDAVRLSANAHAQDSLERAMVDVEELFDIGGPAQEAVECITAAGPLAEAEIAEVLDITPAQARHALITGPCGRMLSTIRSVRRPRFALGHDSLREAILRRSHQPPRHYRRLLVELGDRYAGQGWPDTTPDFFIHDYPAVLAEDNDLHRLSATALSGHWAALQRQRTGSDLDASTALRRALSSYVDDPDLDLSALVPIGMRLHEINPRRHSYPQELLQAWALAGRLDHAGHCACQLNDDKERVKALAALIATAVQTGHLTTARTFLAQAARSALAFDIDADRARHRRAIELTDLGNSLRHLSQDTTPDDEPTEAAEPDSPARTKLELLLRLATPAHTLGELRLAAEINDAIWSLIATDDRLPDTLLLRAAQSAVAVGDSGHLRPALDRLGLTTLNADITALRDRLDAQTAPNALAPDTPTSDSAPRPPPSTAANTRFAQQQDHGPANRRAGGDNADYLVRIETCISAGDLTDAARLIDDFRPRSPRIESLWDLLDPGNEIAGLALMAARQHAAKAVVVIQAAERFVERRESEERARQQPLAVGDGRGRRALGEPAGTFLAQVVETMARHGDLQMALKAAPMKGHPADIEEVLACYAVGVARAGHDTLATRLMHGAQRNPRAPLAAKSLASHWASTSRWRDAIALIPRNANWDRHLITLTALGTAVRSGSIDEAMAVLTSHVDNSFFRCGSGVGAVVEGLTDTGRLQAALALAHVIEDPFLRLALLLKIAERSHEEGYSGAAELVWTVIGGAGATEISDRFTLLADAAEIAARMGRGDAAAAALRRAVQAAYRRREPEQRASALLALATRHETGVTTALGQRLIRAALHEQRTIIDDGSRLPILGAAAEAAYALGDHATADELTDFLLEQPGTDLSLTGTVLAAARHKRTDKARRLLKRMHSLVWDAPVGLISEGWENHARLALTASAAGLWTTVDDIVSALPGHQQTDLFALLAADVVEKDVPHARRLVFRGLLTGLSPRLLAIATCLEPSIAPDAIKWIIQVGAPGVTATPPDRAQLPESPTA